MRSILPFYAALLVALLLVTYVPAFSLTCPACLGIDGGAVDDR